MKAIHLTAYGNPAQNLKMVEIPEPSAPSADEALVRMEYAPVDYSDLLLATGVYFLNPRLPSVIGGEGAGIVDIKLVAMMSTVNWWKSPQAVLLRGT
jgi:NADPH:quinone reductase-like Zn-dependent oxidoreductase